MYFWYNSHPIGQSCTDALRAELGFVGSERFGIMKLWGVFFFPSTHTQSSSSISPAIVAVAMQTSYTHFILSADLKELAGSGEG